MKTFAAVNLTTNYTYVCNNLLLETVDQTRNRKLNIYTIPDILNYSEE